MTMLTLTTLLLLPASAPTPQATELQKAPQKNIVETAIAAGKFKTLATALGKANLVEALTGKGPFTVFAPTDAAFAKLPESTLASMLQPENKAKLTAILTYHVVAGEVGAVKALEAGGAKTLQGDSIRVSISNGQLMINEAKVIANDVRATNGIIHIIDSVLLPPAAAKPEKLTPSATAQKIIEDAIQAGVPLFNGDQPAACVAIYRVAAFSILNFAGDQFSEATRRSLEKSIAAAASKGSDVDKAWALRGSLDLALRDLMRRASSHSKTAKSPARKTKTLFSFDGPKSTSWRTVNDDVMGGVSKGRIEIDRGSATAKFEGALSRKNNGGFSSVRSKSRDLGLRGYKGLLMRVKGDGRTYRVQALVGSSRWNLRNYQAEFRTVKGEWREIAVPFEEMELSVRGRRFPGRTVDGSKVTSIGFSIADKNEAPFALEIDWIRAFRDSSAEIATAEPRPGS